MSNTIEKYHLTPEEVRVALAQFLVDEGKTKILEGVMELTFNLEDCSVDVELHNNNVVH